MKLTSIYKFTSALILVSSISACSLRDRKETHSISVNIPQTIGHASTGLVTPSTISNFDCFALNVIGPGIQSDARYNCKNPDTAMGLIAGFVPAGNTSLDMQVPAGPARNVQLIGIQSTIGCPILEELLKAGGVNALQGFGTPYVLGSATTDIFDDVSVTINASYTQGVTPAAFQGCGVEGSENAIALGWYQSTPTSTSSIQAMWTKASKNLANQKIQFFNSPTCTSMPVGSEIDLMSDVTEDYIFNGSDGLTYYFKITSVDTSGNTHVSACSSGLAIDVVAPVPTITTTLAANPTTHTSIPIHINFSEPVVNFIKNDLTFNGDGYLDNFVQVSPSFYTVDIILNSGSQGTVTLDLNQGMANDLAGNGNDVASQFTIDTFYDLPVVIGPAITNDPNQLVMVDNLLPGLDAVLYDDAGCSNPVSSPFNATMTTEDLSPNPISATTTFYADMVDSTGFHSPCSLGFTVIYDVIQPTAIINTPANPTVTDLIPVNIIFSEPVTGFTSADVTINTGTIVGFSGTGANYSFYVDLSAPGVMTTVSVSVAGGSATDYAGNSSVPSSTFYIDYYPKPTSVTGALPQQTLTPLVTVGGTAVGLIAKIYSDSGCTSLLGSQAGAAGSTGVTSGVIATDTTYYADLLDADGNYSDCSAASFNFVYDPVMILPGDMIYPIGQGLNLTYSAQGGSGGFTYSIFGGGPGTINSVTGLYTSAAGTRMPDTDTIIRATDSGGRFADVSIKHAPMLTNGAIKASVDDGSSLYVGGQFTSAFPYVANGMMTANPNTGAILDYSIASSFNGSINAIVTYGNIAYIGGSFTKYKNNTIQNLAKIDLLTGKLDTTFSQATGPASAVNALAISPDGARLFVGGSFTTYRGAAYYYLLKLDTTSGNIDATFHPSTGPSNSPNAIVYALALSGTDLYVGGNFTQYRASGNGYMVAKVSATTGVLETTNFNNGASVGPNGPVRALLVDGADLYIAGSFTQYRAVAAGAYLAKVDTTTATLMNAGGQFHNAGTTPNGPVYSLAHNGAYLYLGGSFTNYRSQANSAYLARVNKSDGSFDTGFSGGTQGPNNIVYSMFMNGSDLYVGGSFTSYRANLNGHHMIRVNSSTGSLDTANFNNTLAGVNGQVNAIALSGDSSKLAIGGTFTSFGGIPVQNLAKFYHGSWMLDTTFTQSTGPDADVLAMVRNGGYLYIGGAFQSYRGDTRGSYLAKVNEVSGVLETGGFNTISGITGGPNNIVNAIVTDGTNLYVGGNFTLYRNDSKGTRLVKVDASTGTMDTGSFNTTPSSGPNAPVNSLAINGSDLYVGGAFTSYRGSSNGFYLAKVSTATGSLDTANFNTTPSSGPNAAVYSLAVFGADLFAGGVFTNYRSNVNGPNLVKLNLTTGVMDSTFNSTSQGPNGAVYSIAVTASDLYIGGAFSAYRSNANGAFVARLNKMNGNLDTASFNSIAPIVTHPGAAVNSLALTPDTMRLFVGGTYQHYQDDLTFQNGCMVDAFNATPSW